MMNIPKTFLVACILLTNMNRINATFSEGAIEASPEYERCINKVSTDRFPLNGDCYITSYAVMEDRGQLRDITSWNDLSSNQSDIESQEKNYNSENMHDIITLSEDRSGFILKNSNKEYVINFFYKRRSSIKRIDQNKRNNDTNAINQALQVIVKGAMEVNKMQEEEEEEEGDFDMNAGVESAITGSIIKKIDTNDSQPAVPSMLTIPIQDKNGYTKLLTISRLSTIYELKKKIKENYLTQNEEVTGLIFEDDAKVKDYVGLDKGFSIDQIFKDSEFDIYFKTLNNKTITIKVNKKTTQGEIKQKIEDKENIARQYLRLSFLNKSYDNDNITVQEMGLNSSNTYYILKRLKGGKLEY